MEERLQKYLSECGIASRRNSEKLIKAGHISVNKIIVKDMGKKIDSDMDEVRYDDKLVIKLEKRIYIMLNKPEYYITTTNEQFGRPKVTDLVNGINENIYPIGRLDYNSSGLLLLTNDGELTFKLTHPGYEINKDYAVKIKGVPDSIGMKKLRSSILINGRMTSRADVSIIEIKNNQTTLKITIHEGRNREIRNLCSYAGYDVIELRRTAYGELTLGDLGEGKWRFLNSKEVDYLKNL